MTEPTYKFVRGTGWVPDYTPPVRSLIVKCIADGLDYRLEVRNPEPGEYYEWVLLPQDDWAPNGVADLDVFGEYTRTYGVYEKWGLHETPAPNAVYVTVIPL